MPIASQRIDVNARYGINALPILLYGTEAINNSIFCILSSNLKSRAFHPEYGSLLPRSLWEPCDETTAQLLKVSTYKAIEKFEPDVIVNTSTSQVIPLASSDGFQIIINYTERNSGSPGQANFIFVR